MTVIRITGRFLGVIVLLTGCSFGATLQPGVEAFQIPRPTGMSTITPGKISGTSQQPTNCEDLLLYLDDAIAKAQDLKESYIIVIARLGNEEKSNRLRQIRLHSIESYLTRKGVRRLVTAEAGRVEGLGRIEIYVGGKLLHIMPLAKNARSFCPTPVG